RGGNAADAYAGGVVNRVQDGRSCRNHCLLANTLGAKWADGRGIFYKDGLNRRHVAGGWNQIVMKILALAGEELLHQGHPQTLGSTPLDLSLDEYWVDGAADIMCGGNFQDAHRAEFDIDFNFSQVRAEAENGIGNTLTIFVERAGGWIECGFAGENVSVLIARQIAQMNGLLLLPLFDFEPAIAECDRVAITAF